MHAPNTSIETKTAAAFFSALVTIALSILLVGVKLFAFVASGSMAVLSSLIDSVMDVALSSMNYCALRYAVKPADEDHRSGHGKMEGLAALMQAVVIGGGAFFICWEAGQRLFHAQEITAHIPAMIVIGASLFVSALIVFIQNRAIAKSGSLTIEADKAHYSTDIIMNVGVILALGAQYIGAPVWLDTCFALAVALWMGVTAYEIGEKGLDMILDKELPAEQRQKILDIIKTHSEVLGLHDLRATRYGMAESISFDIEVDPELSLKKAHDITKDLEREILEIFPHAEVMIHVDPHGDIEDSRHKVASVHY